MEDYTRCGNCKHLLNIAVSGADGSVYRNYVCVRNAPRIIRIDGPYAPHLVSRPEWCLGRQDKGEVTSLSMDQLRKIHAALCWVVSDNPDNWRGVPISRIYESRCSDWFDLNIDATDIKEILFPDRWQPIALFLFTIIFIAIMAELQ